MKLTLAISPCPNDTFMFDALLNGRIDGEGLRWEVAFHDIEELNAGALHGAAQVTKLSAAVVPRIADRYRILDSGSALGRGNGPLWVARRAVDPADPRLRVAVPGLHTTANLLMERLFPHIRRKEAVLFSQIAPRVADGTFDAGVLIHEGRFTYASHGLHLVADLGAEWERRTGLPLPLGAIAVSRSLPDPTQRLVARVLRRSVEYALTRPDASADFVRAHAQEMDPDVTRRHIDLFVNRYSVSLGSEGRAAYRALLGNTADDLFVG